MGIRFLAVGAVWLGAAYLAGATGLTLRMQPPLPQVILFGSTALLVLAYALGGPFRAWLDKVGLRPVLGLHLSRLVGIYFLVLHSRGELPYAFAVPGGWGDIVSATGAMFVMTATSSFSVRRPLIYAWSVWGLIDILMVVATATRLFLADPASMHALLVLPLSLLPTFLVPLIIASHLLVFRRLAMARDLWR